jgi:lysozyme
MIMNEEGLKIIKKYETFKPVAYQCPRKIWTIGYGHTKGVRPGDKITKAQAEELLRQDIDEVERKLKYLVIGAMLNVDQWSALVSLVFNIGLGHFERSTLRKLLPYSKEKAAEEFSKWIYCDGVPLNGLKKRRLAERALFLGTARNPEDPPQREASP